MNCFLLLAIVGFESINGFRLATRSQQTITTSTIARLQLSMQETSSDPLLLRAARGEKVDRVPVWMMRQAGRHLQVYRDLCVKHKTFRERSENPDLATEIR